MKHCRNCGGQVEDNDIYCGYCGCKLKQDEDFTQENGYCKQDFEEVTSAKDDFHSDIDKEFDKEFSNDFEKNDGFVNSQSEFESHVEHGGQVFTTSSHNNNGSHGHKQLLFNKFAKDANTYGILALIFGIPGGILGIVFGAIGILGGILGIVFGAIGLTKAQKALELCNTGEYDGKPKATNGRVLSIVGIVLGALSVMFYII
ncbi:MAG: hypothetical protein K2L52_01845 [Clostridia bacterium]|nr:hypothetical protein [Clostridia bacterium]